MSDARARLLRVLSEEQEYLRVRSAELADERRRFEERIGSPITEASTEEAFRDLLDTLRRLGNVALATKVLAARQRLQSEMEALEQANEQLEHELATGTTTPVTEEQLKAAPNLYEALDHYDRVLAEATAWLQSQENGGA